MRIPFLSLLLLTLTAARAVATEPTWSINLPHRLLVEVPPVDLGKRASDDRPAELQIDFAARLKQRGITRRPNLATLRVVEYDPATGKPIRFAKAESPDRPHDRPFRWYDGAIPYRFPEFRGSNSATKGRIVRRPRVRGGYFLNTLGDWKTGRLAWVHTQRGKRASHYAIYFDLLPKGKPPQQSPPRGWLGDGMPRCAKESRTTLGSDHTRIDLADWNGDGLVDVIIGEENGHLMWMPNIGTKAKPKFGFTKLVFDADGQPIDAGTHFAPKVVDWNGDGKPDLLAGTYRNRVVYYENVSDTRKSSTGPKLRYRGQVQLAGKPFQLPVKPLARGNENIFKTDYYPVLETADYDGDGDLDLLAGGYITGRIYLYENTGRQSDGTPALRFAGPIHADGKPLNVGHWCAAPCLADLDGDGDLDLLSGRMPMYDYGKRPNTGDDFLRYYKNIGTRTRPAYQRAKLPSIGKFPVATLATPRVADLTGDGDLDLVVSSRLNIYEFRNVGTKTKPLFAAHRNHKQLPWGNSPLAVSRFLDWNRDGRPDIVRNYTVTLNTGRGYPATWGRTLPILLRGTFISHPAKIGDDWFQPYVDDFDGDGRHDVLFGDWHGHVWFHRNRSTGDVKRFDIKGERLRLKSGEPIKVGPLNADPKKNFTTLQGARTVLTAGDYNGDGRRDLVLGDTFGKVRYFRNIGTKAKPVFAKPVEVGDLKIRLLVDTTDWNGDGQPDIIAGAANGRVRVFLNTGRQTPSRFAAGLDPKLPPILQPRVLTADLNNDGDTDLFLPSTQGSCFVERSFLRYGYGAGKLLRFESRRNVRR